MKTIRGAAFGGVFLALAAGCQTDMASALFGEDDVADQGVVETAAAVQATYDKDLFDADVARIERRTRSNLEAKVKSGKFYTKYNSMRGSEIETLLGRKLSAEDLGALESAAESITRRLEGEIVWPALKEAIMARVSQSVERLVAAGDYAGAREMVWRASTTGIPEIDGEVRDFGYKLLNIKVNPRNWEAIEQDVLSHCKAFAEEGKYEEGVEWLKAYPRVRTFSESIDGKLGAARDELLKLGVAAESVDPVVASNLELVAAAEEIADTRDNTTAVGIAAVAEPSDVDLSEFEKKLKAYRDALVRYNCSEAEADRIVRQFRAGVGEYVQALGQKGAAAPASKSLLYLGTAAVNRRLDALRAAKIAEFEKEMSARSAPAEGAGGANSLGDFDAEVSFDAQIAMAEDAISRQLGASGPESCLDMNAVLGSYARIMRLMKRGADEVSSADATTLLVGAVYLNQPAVFARAVKLGADVNSPAARDPRGRPALLVAIQTGNTSFVKAILDAGGDQTASDAAGNTALHYAMTRGDLAAAKAFATAVDAAAVNADGETALFAAVRRNQAASVRFLVGLVAEDGRAAYVGMKNNAGEDAFAAACRANANTVLDVLADAGAKYGESNLAVAASLGHVSVAQWLVERGLDVNAPGVMEACRDGEVRAYLSREGGVAGAKQSAAGK